MLEKAHEIAEQNEAKYDFIGLRFEDKEREEGETCETSRHNLDREDEREFPEYGTEEYEEMFELDGTSAWHIEYDAMLGYNDRDMDKDAESLHNVYHAYIIGGNEITNKDDALDEGEIVIKNAKVIAKLY